MEMVDLGPAAMQLAGLVTRVPDAELGNPTPCPAYTLGDLIDHVGGLALALAGRKAQPGPRADPAGGAWPPRGLVTLPRTGWPTPPPAHPPLAHPPLAHPPLAHPPLAHPPLPESFTHSPRTPPATTWLNHSSSPVCIAVSARYC